MQLNNDQKRAVLCDGHCLVVACPGSGKTRLLVEKAVRLFSKNPETRLIIVSFTRDSVREIRGRIAKALGGTVPKSCVVSTFHSLALKQLRRAMKIPQLISGDKQANYAYRAWQKYGSADIAEEDALSVIENARTQIGQSLDPDSFNGKMVSEYIHLMELDNCMDMSDILTRVVEGLFVGTIEPFKADFIFVDECQDIDEIQLQWVMCHANAGSKITLVGDDDQSIYRFRSALGYSGMMRFENDTAAERVMLSVNYRCNSEIISAAEKIILPNTNRVPKNLEAFRGIGGKVTLHRLLDKKQEAMWVATAISKKLREIGEQEPKSGLMAVLARNKHLLDEIEGACAWYGIPTLRTQGKSIWEKAPVVFLVGFLSALVKPRRSGVDSFLAWLIQNPNDMDVIHDQTKGSVHTLLEAGTPFEFAGLSSTARDLMKSFCQTAPIWRKQAQSSDIAQHTSTISSVFEWATANATRQTGIVLLGFAAEAMSKMNGLIQERIKRVSNLNLDKDSDSERNGVFLTTIHGSKGLEFDYVWLMGISSEVIPNSESPIDEERRLFYVGITRAKNEVFITCNSAQPPSIFYEELGGV